jgi:hypothetical protein
MNNILIIIDSELSVIVIEEIKIKKYESKINIRRFNA